MIKKPYLVFKDPVLYTHEADQAEGWLIPFTYRCRSWLNGVLRNDSLDVVFCRNHHDFLRLIQRWQRSGDERATPLGDRIRYQYDAHPAP